MIEPSIVYNPNMQWILNAVLALITLGIALELKLKDFEDVLKEPRNVIIGLLTQFLLLPSITFLLINLLEVEGGLALGMLLVGCCPGGGMSNLFTQLAKGNSALSITMTATSSTLAMFLMPINFIFWASLYSESANLLQEFEIDRIRFMMTLIIILAIPLTLGLWMRAKYEDFALKLLKPLRIFSMLALTSFIVVGILGNRALLADYISMVFWLVFIHNTCALTLGFLTAKLTGLPPSDQKAISLEVGIQNSGLGLVVIFSFFDGNGYMALIAAWWGIWHLIAGFFLSQFYRRFYSSH